MNKLTAKLSRSVPCAVSESGLVLVFDTNLTPRERAKVFDCWPCFAGLEMPSGYFRNDSPLDPTCGAYRIRAVIAKAAKVYP